MQGSVVQKGGVYYCVYRVNGRQKWIAGGPTKKQAEMKLVDIVKEINDDTYREIKEISFEKFVDLWLDTYAKTRLKPSTLLGYKVSLRKHLVPYFESTRLRRISTGRLQQYVYSKLKEVSAKTVVNHLVPLRLMFKHAVRWGYLKQNPADYVERPRVERKEMAFLEPSEVRAFLQEVSAKYYALFLTAVLTGLRRGELLGLQVDDLNFHKNQIHVRRALWKKTFITPKTKYSIRAVDMTPVLAYELKKHVLSKPHSDAKLLFCSDEGKPLDADALVRRQFIPALKRAKLHKIRFHDLRHTNVALRIAEGQNIKYIQYQLGHSSIQTTLDRYGHLLSDANQEQAKNLDNRLGLNDQSKILLEKC